MNKKHKPIERLIKEFHHKWWLRLNGFVKERNLVTKTGNLILYIINVIATGFLIHYSLTHYNFLSLGIASALAMYYVEWFVKLVKKKEEDNE